MSSNRDYREFDANSIIDKLSTLSTVNLNDYEMVGEGLARVVVSYTGDIQGEDFRAKLAEKFNGLAMPIKHSWKRLTANSVMGWISANREIREYDEVEQGKKYRALASNILMDRDDETTWQLKETESGGKYLCRQGIEDLSEIAHTLNVRKTGIPLLAAVASAEVDEREFVAFINKQEGEVDYGYVVAKEEKGIKSVLSAITQEVSEVDPVCIIHATNLMGADVKAYGKEVAASDKQTVIDYYKTLYRYSPEYIQEVINCINDMSFA